MPKSWIQDVRGDQVLPLINSDAKAIRCVAGPGSGKTFGLVRRVERILHPEGLAVGGEDVLVVAFNRVIARQLQRDIDERLRSIGCDQKPVIRTIHALCVEVIGEELRLLLPHEREAMMYDVLEAHPAVKKLYKDYYDACQALRDHEANHQEHLPLWKAAGAWLVRHKAHLVGDLPRMLLDRMKGGDFGEQSYHHVIVDEFQDLTAGEQELMIRLRRVDGHLVALGDPRQSIYSFRGNDREGLSKLEALIGPGGKITDVPILECQRCPKEIVHAANKLMALADVQEMKAVSQAAANIHVVTWKTPEAEAAGMAEAIANNIAAHPKDRHLAMVTRRRIGYWLRDKLNEVKSDLRVELGFSEGLLESWAAREAFLLLCLLVDPDRPTWRAWLGCKNSSTGKDFSAPSRSAAAYLKILKEAKDEISIPVIEALSKEPRGKSRGAGGIAVWERAERFMDLWARFPWDGKNAGKFVKNLFDPKHWIGDGYDEALVPGATLDLNLLCEKTLALLEEEAQANKKATPKKQLQKVAERLRHQIATNEPLASDEACDLQVATLWGAKGVTAEHIYILGSCGEALPGECREEYPGTEAEFVEEQRRLFYVSITRTKRTMVISRPLRVKIGAAKQLGLAVRNQGGFWAELKMSPFLREVMAHLPDAVPGESWGGCVS